MRCVNKTNREVKMVIRGGMKINRRGNRNLLATTKKVLRERYYKCILLIVITNISGLADWKYTMYRSDNRM